MPRLNSRKTTSQSFPTSTTAPLPTTTVTLTNGVNLGNQHITGSTLLDDSDYAALSGYGVDHVRIPLAPTYLFTDTTYASFNTSNLARVHQIVTKVLQYGMIAILDCHPLMDGVDYQNFLTGSNADTYWTKVATEFKRYGLNLYYEVLNEPGNSPYFPGESTWKSWHTARIATIRTADPTSGRKIVVNAQYSAYFTGFNNTTPFSGDSNIIYSFHYYSPFSFTHQTAATFGLPYGLFSGVRYPTSTSYIDNQFNTVASGAYAGTSSIERTTTYNRTQIATDIANAVNWGTTNSVPIHLGEFGVYQGVTTEPDLSQWFIDVLNVCKDYNLPRCMFAYDSNFPLSSTILTYFQTSKYPLEIVSSAFAAYSVRKLRSAYTGYCLKVRRSSDNTEQDIGFTSTGDLDTAAMLTFVGANNGFVTKWYDQSGNGRDVSNATTTQQPKIVNAGSLLTNGGKASILFDGTDDLLRNSTGAGLYAAGACTVLTVAKMAATTSRTLFAEGGSATGSRYRIVGSDSVTGDKNRYYVQNNAGSFVNGNITNTAASYNNSLNVVNITDSGTAFNSYANGTAGTSSGYARPAAPTGLDSLNVGGEYYGTSSNFWNGYVSEIIAYSSVLSTTNRQILGRHMSSHFGDIVMA